MIKCRCLGGAVIAAWNDEHQTGSATHNQFKIKVLLVSVEGVERGDAEVKNRVGGKPGNDSKQVGGQAEDHQSEGDGLMGTRLENTRLQGEKKKLRLTQTGVQGLPCKH